MLSSFICSEINLMIMDQNLRVLISTMILGRLFCQRGPHTELMQTPKTNYPKLNCKLLQQQNPSMQGRHQQQGQQGESTSKQGGGAKGCREGSGTLNTHSGCKKRGKGCCCTLNTYNNNTGMTMEATVTSIHTTTNK
jgi:hypothetical protein